MRQMVAHLKGRPLPYTKDTLAVLAEDLNAVASSEPRVNLVDLRIVPLYDRNVVIASLVLYYVELDFTDQFDVSIQFES